MTDGASSVPLASHTPSRGAVEQDVRARQPQRTCIGCRVRADRSSLLRVVAAGDSGSGSARAVEPDAAARRPGRGAWVHEDPACFQRAVKRRAFGRALRLDGALDLDAVREHVSASTTSPPSTSSGSGSAPDGHPMSYHR